MFIFITGDDRLPVSAPADVLQAAHLLCEVVVQYLRAPGFDLPAASSHVVPEFAKQALNIVDEAITKLRVVSEPAAALFQRCSAPSVLARYTAKDALEHTSALLESLMKTAASSRGPLPNVCPCGGIDHNAALRVWLL